MNQKESQSFVLIWRLLEAHHELLGDVLPIVHEIERVLSEDRIPSPEQLGTWKARYDEMSQRLLEMTVKFEAVRQVVEPTFDA